MNIQKITPSRNQLLLWLLLIQAAVFAQVPTITSFSPTKVTYRTVVTINGTGFTSAMASSAANVKFNGVTSGGITYVSPTQIKVAVPAITATGSGSSVHTFTVTTAAGTSAQSGSITYIAPVNTVFATAKITRIITNWEDAPGGMWVSTATSAVAANRPDKSHSLLAFQYGNILYSTGGESAIVSTLNANGFTEGNGVNANTYKVGNFRALPISNLEGTVGSNANLIVLGSKVDGNGSAQVPTAPSVNGLKIRDVLIDGIRGLDLGTGVTNLPASSVMLFQATDIVGEGIDDAVPDIMVTQVAEPGSTDIFSFVDSSGNVVGQPIMVTFNQVPPVGTYKTDFFTLPAGQQLNTAVVNGSTTIGNNYRDYRLVAYKLSEFGIDQNNKAQAANFKVMPSGSSDPAFLAYNRNSFQVPAPEITGQPTSQVSCIGGTSTFSLQVSAIGTENTFQWRLNGNNLVNGTFNGVTISGANSTSLTINPVTAAYVGTYTAVVTSTANGTIAITSPVYLNAAISSISGAVACVNQPAIVEVGAQGAGLQYQWYTTNTVTTDSNGNLIPVAGTGTLISGATASTYSAPTSATGTKFYYVKVWNASAPIVNGEPCTAVYSNAVSVVVGTGASAGTASPNQSVCAGATPTISLTGVVGTVQWQQSTDGNSNWVNVSTGSGGTSTAYTTPALTATTYYRAVVTSPNGSCSTNSTTIVITVADVTTWEGDVDDQWNTPGNWSCGTVPTQYNDVIIPGGLTLYPHVIGTTGFAKTLSITAAGSNAVVPTVTVLTNGSLSVVNTITVAPTAKLVVENNGSLSQTNNVANTGVATVKRNSNPLFRLDYTLWSAPVTGQSLGLFSPFTAPNRFYTFNGPANQYAVVPGVSAAGPNFQPAEGYLIRMPNSINGTVFGTYYAGTSTYVFPGVFTGTLNNGTYSKTLNTANGAYTATGNPYPSPISVRAFFNQNGLTAGGSSSTGVLAGGSGIYFWRKKNDFTVSTYATVTLLGLQANAATPEAGGPSNPEYSNTGGQQMSGYFGGGINNNSNWIISPGQGFIVKANASLNNPQLIFNNAMRRTAPATGGQPFFKGLDNNSSRFWLNLSSATAFSQVLVGYTPETTLGMDFGYDATRLDETNSNNVVLYTTVDDNKMAIEARPAFDSSDVLPLSYTAVVPGQYTFTLDNAEGVFEDGQDIFLKDKLVGTTHNISEGAYNFTTAAGDFGDRFEIVYMQPSLGTANPELNANSVIVYQQGNTINITSGDLDMTDVTIYDVRGSKIYTKSGINATETSISNLAVQQQVLIIEINTLKGKVTKKIIF